MNLYPLPGLVSDLAATLLDQAALSEMLYFADKAPYGSIVEIGVYKGGAAWLLAHLGRTLYLYDTFEGHPYDCAIEPEVHPKGRFSDVDESLVRQAIPCAHIIKGTFPDSIVNMAPVGFVHADLDTYQGTKAILEHMPRHMVRGGMILFDDYPNDGCEGCRQAIHESGIPFLQTLHGRAVMIF